jgi:hypothetical protein
MASGAPDREGRFVVDEQSFHGIILGSQVFFLVSGHSGRRGG